MSIRHHPASATLAAYAAGALDEARAVVIATHLDFCADCRRAVADFEALGGVALEEIEPAEMSADALQRFWLRAGEAIDIAPQGRPANDRDVAGARPLAAYLPGGLDSIDWRPLAPGMAQAILPAEGYRPGVLRLLKIEPGQRMPRHTHRDGELTLILKGAYEDEIGEFRAGDLADLSDEDTHSPLAIGDEPCICLIATNAPLIFKDVIGKVMQPLIRL